MGLVTEFCRAKKRGDPQLPEIPMLTYDDIRIQDCLPRTEDMNSGGIDFRSKDAMSYSNV